MGTSKGTLRKVGSNTVKVGIANAKFLFCCWNKFDKSSVLNRTINDKTNTVHSNPMLNGLPMPTPKLKSCLDGQRSQTCPVK